MPMGLKKNSSKASVYRQCHCYYYYYDDDYCYYGSYSCSYSCYCYCYCCCCYRCCYYYYSSRSSSSSSTSYFCCCCCSSVGQCHIIVIICFVSRLFSSLSFAGGFETPLPFILGSVVCLADDHGRTHALQQHWANMLSSFKLL